MSVPPRLGLWGPMRCGSLAPRGKGVRNVEAITEGVQTALFNVQTDAMALIGTVLPYALAIMGAIIVVTIGIRVFKRVTGR